MSRHHASQPTIKARRFFPKVRRVKIHKTFLCNPRQAIHKKVLCILLGAIRKARVLDPAVPRSEPCSATGVVSP